jgi:tetratricopeptide (TPR) repeat protein
MKVFISSTFVDLEPYRRVAIEVVNRQNCQPLAMEHFGARPAEPTAVCEEEVRACDILVGIYAHRFGFVPDGQEKSITQQEYELAMALGKDCLCFLVQKGFDWNPDFVQFDKKAQLESFLAQVKKQHAVDFFSTPQDFGNKLTTSLTRLRLEKQGVTSARSGTAVPSAVSYFTGRRQDLQKLRALLTQPRAFVCILNAPGIGKTQLSLKAAEEFRDLFPDAVYFLDLGRRNAVSPEAIVDVLRETLGIAEPLPFEKLLQRVAAQRCLFILDNLETALWPPAEANATRAMLRRWLSLLAPGQAILTPSRAAAQAGEVCLDLLPLAFAECLELWQKLRPETPTPSPALQELLQLAEGYPLVLYLLSQRALEAPLPALLQDFRRRKIAAAKIGEGREASVEASIALSYEALPPSPRPGRRLFHLLGFLPAGAAMATMEALCGAEWMEAWKEVRHAGLGLWRGERFFALPPLRDFAGQRASAEERQALCDFYLKAAGEQDEHFRRDELGETARQWLQAELPNLHHLWDVQDDKKWILALAETLAGIYQDGVRVGAARLQAAAAAAAEIGARLGEANCIQSRGDVHSMLDEYVEARGCYEKAEPIYREIGDRLGEANCLRFQALLEIKETNYKLALNKFERALSIAKAIGDRFTQAFILMERLEPLLELNQKLQAQESLNQAISLFEAINRPDRAQ